MEVSTGWMRRRAIDVTGTGTLLSSSESLCEAEMYVPAHGTVLRPLGHGRLGCDIEVVRT